ncbi:MAG: RNA-binding S4 domain-containing protein [Alphaproteobacteria bacterium]|nr:RNA-binding S4 domain-containing protein [Alphaproteobacteria bacterium]
MRLDVWLWRTRFFKTRSLAAAAISDQGFRIERQGHVRRVSKAAIDIAPGDILSFASHGRTVLIRIRALPERRGPAPEAAVAYEALGAHADENRQPLAPHGEQPG